MNRRTCAGILIEKMVIKLNFKEKHTAYLDGSTRFCGTGLAVTASSIARRINPQFMAGY